MSAPGPDLAPAGRQASRRLARKIEHRCAVVLEVLASGQEMAVEELIERRDASAATVRRDLRRLEERGLVGRAHGVVALAESRGYEPFLGDPGFRVQVRHMAANAAMARQARKRILLADHTKFGHTARFLVCPIGDVDMIVTGAGASDEIVAPFQRLGIQVVRV